MSTQATVQYTNTAYTPKKQENKDDKQPRSFRYLCPKCKGPVKEHHTDDVQTWYVCTKNPGHLTAAPLKQEFDDIEQYQEWFCANIGKALAEKKAKEAAFQEELKQLALNPAIEQFILDEVHRTVSSHDDHVIKAVFHAGISAYASPLNLALKCESGSGKTYSTTQTIKFLPPENVLLIGSQSPKVISHENGTRKTPDGRNFDDISEPQKPRREYEPDPEVYRQLLKNYEEEKKTYNKLKEESFYEVDLHNKILVFLEPNSSETFRMLKPTLSHDDEHIDHKYVDDKGKVHITRLYGFPTAIFNSLDNEYMSEFATRTLTITPTTTPSKIASAIQISNEKSSFPWQYQKISHNKQLIHELIRKIRNVITKEKIQVVNPFPNLRRFFSQSNVRDMRDFNHYLELLPSYTILKLYQRPLIAVEDKNYLVATIQDVIDAKTLFDSIAETTKTGTEQRIINFYNQHVKPKVNGTTINILTDEYNKTHKDRKSSKTISNWMNRLVEIEFVDARKGLTSDGHTITYFPLKGVDVDKNQSDLAEAGIFQQNRTEIEAFLQKDFEEWLKRAEEETPLTPQIIEFNGATRTLSREEFIKIVTSTLKDPISSPQTNNKPSPNEENNAKTVPFSGNRTVTANSPAPADVDQATGTQCTLPEAPIQ